MQVLSLAASRSVTPSAACLATGGMKATRSQAQVLCTVKTKRWPLSLLTLESSTSSSSSGRGLPFDGVLTLEQLGPIAFVLRYSDAKASSVTDIDLVRLEPDSSTFSSQPSSSLQASASDPLHTTSSGLSRVILHNTIILHIPSSVDFSLLSDCIFECRSLTALTLRLEIVSRDVYYANAYANGAIEKDSAKEVARMREAYVRGEGTCHHLSTSLPLHLSLLPSIYNSSIFYLNTQHAIHRRVLPPPQSRIQAGLPRERPGQRAER